MKTTFALAIAFVLMGCTAASSKDSDGSVEKFQHSTDPAPIPFGARVQLGSKDFITVTRVDTHNELRTEAGEQPASTGCIFVSVEYILKAPTVAPEQVSSFPALSLVSPQGRVYKSHTELEHGLADEVGFTRRATDVLKVSGQILDILVFEVPADQFDIATWQILTDNETHIALK